LDYDMFEKKFIAKAPVEKPAESKPKGPTIMTFVDPKIAQNFNIWFSKYKKSGMEEVIKSAKNLDSEVFDAVAVQALSGFVPTDDDNTNIGQYLDGGGEFNMLGAPEQFMWQFGKVPDIAQRLQCFKYMITFEPKKVDLHPDIVTLKQVAQYVKTDSKIAKLLEIVLHVGNFLNAGNSRLGTAYGFSLDTLSKLQDTKTTDNKATVFEIIVEMVKDTKQDLLKFPKTEIDLLEAGSRVSLQTIDGELKKLRKEFDSISALAPSIGAHDDAQDLFQSRWTAFSEKAIGDLAELEGDLKTSVTEYENLVQAFAEDPKIMGPEEFFAVWKNFIAKVVEISEKIDEEREKTEKLRKREEAKKKREEQLAEGKHEASGSGEAEGAAPTEGGRGATTRGRGRGGPAARGRGRGAEDVNALFAKMKGGLPSTQ